MSRSNYDYTVSFISTRIKFNK